MYNEHLTQSIYQYLEDNTPQLSHCDDDLLRRRVCLHAIPAILRAPNNGCPRVVSPFSLFGSESNFKPIEIYGLLTVLGIAIAGLLYALMLVKQVRKADQGTKKNAGNCCRCPRRAQTPTSKHNLKRSDH